LADNNNIILYQEVANGGTRTTIIDTSQFDPSNGLVLHVGYGKSGTFILNQ
jgi:hypothetical protein